MTEFDELVDITSRKNKHKSSEIDHDDADYELEVAGSKASKSPLLSCSDDEKDGSIIDDLYRKAMHKPNDGYGSAP